jgi:hypothetical protein
VLPSDASIFLKLNNRVGHLVWNANLHVHCELGSFGQSRWSGYLCGLYGARAINLGVLPWIGENFEYQSWRCGYKALN